MLVSVRPRPSCVKADLHQPLVDVLQVEGGGIGALAVPEQHIVVLRVGRARDGLQEVHVAGLTADVFRRAP
jgi:hypothetical protein